MEDNWDEPDATPQIQKLQISDTRGKGRGRLFAGNEDSGVGLTAQSETANSDRGGRHFGGGGGGNNGYSRGGGQNRDAKPASNDGDDFWDGGGANDKPSNGNNDYNWGQQSGNSADNSQWKPEGDSRSERYGRGGDNNRFSGRGDRGGNRGYRNNGSSQDDDNGYSNRRFRGDSDGGGSRNFRGQSRGDGFRRGRGGGSYSNNEDSNEDGGGRGWGMNDDRGDDQQGRGSRGSRGGGRFPRGDRRGGFNDRGSSDQGGNPNGEGGGDGEERPTERKVPFYIPEELPDSQLFDGIPQGINFDRYKDIKAKITGRNPPPKITSFQESNLRPFLLENIDKAKYTTPTPVQQYGIPVILQKRDLMACAQTGSGKTAAFLLPILHNLLSGGDLEGASFKEIQEPYALILAPTRELAIQIHREARKFSQGSIVRTGILYGGVNVGYQLREIKKGIHLLVATPGRLVDSFGRLQAVSFSKLRYLVLDEGDRMLDLGFIEDLQKLQSHPSMPPKNERTTLMFSATFSEKIQNLAADFLEDHLFLSVGIVGGANNDVRQCFIETTRAEKNDKLISLVLENPEQTAIIFVATKRQTDFVCSQLCGTKKPGTTEDLKATSIHGDRQQQQREEAIADFKSRKFPLLVATGVASRGLDINGVDHVINYDLPQEIDEYVHRIGRTGRVGNLGRSTSFFNIENDSHLVHPLIKILKDAQQDIPDWLLRYGENSGLSSGNFSNSGVFGGRDIRSFKSNAPDQWDQPAAAKSGGGDDEMWD